MSELTSEQVAAFLRANPDFFESDPNTLALMTLPGESTDAASLAQWQVSRLRDENAQLRGDLDALVAVARENESLMEKMHALSLRLLDASGVGEFVDEIFASLRDTFAADHTTLVLFSELPALRGRPTVRYCDRGDKAWRPFKRLLAEGEPFSGRPGAARIKFLFDQSEQPVQSAALLPLDDLGLLGIGAHDLRRFHPDMGTAFLRVLADLLTAGLRRHAEGASTPASDQRRAG